MPILSASEIKGYAAKAGFKGNDLNIAVAVALAESGGNTEAHNHSGKDNSYGLWQINMYGSMGPARQRQFHLATYADLFQPDVNARAAKAIHSSQGWDKGWTTYKSGKYKQYMDKASNVTPAEPSDDIGNQIADKVQALNPVTGVSEAINSFGSTLFKGLTNVSGIIVAIALLGVGFTLLILSSNNAKKAANIAANIVPGGQVVKGAVKKVTT
jgi:lysozyme-like protein